MTRAELAAWVGVRYAAYLEAAGRTSVDTTGNLKEPIDDALLILGYAEADLATIAPTEAGPINDLRAVTAYTTMLQVVRDLGSSIDLSVEGDNYRLSQMLAAAEKELERTAAAVLARDLPLVIEGTSTGMGAWNLNFLPT